LHFAFCICILHFEIAKITREYKIVLLYRRWRPTIHDQIPNDIFWIGCLHLNSYFLFLKCTQVEVRTKSSNTGNTHKSAFRT
jgi:hypothetical protein